jgi:hypothetical protein
MWVRGAAIRPVPSYAVVERSYLDRLEEELAANDFPPQSDLDDAFGRFEQSQPALAQHAAHVLARPLDETALALGYFLTIAVWLGFQRSFGARLDEVSERRLEEARSSLTLEEELRATHSDEPLELEDVMAVEQPGILAFINEHVEAALEPVEDHGTVAREGRAARDIDIDDVHSVYRSVLVMILALSYAVAPASGPRPREMLA